MTNATLRQRGLARHGATVALTGLVTRGLAVTFDGRRYAKYALAVPSSEPAHAVLDGPITAGTPPYDTTAPADTPTPRRNRLAEIDALFDSGTTLAIGDVTATTGLKDAMASRYLA